MITWYGVSPSAAAEAVLRPAPGRPGRSGAPCPSGRGVALTGKNQVVPGTEHALQVVRARRGEHGVHGAARRGLLEPAPDVTGQAVHPLGHFGEREAGADVDRVDVGPGRQDRPAPRRTPGSGASRSSRGRSVCRGRPPRPGRPASSRSRAAGSSASTMASSTRPVHRDHHLRPGRARGVGLQLVPEHEGQDEHEQAAADAGRIRRRRRTRAERAARRPDSGLVGLAVVWHSASPAPSRRRLRLRLAPAAATAALFAVALVPSSPSAPLGPLTRCPARLGGAPWRPHCRRPCGPPCRCAPRRAGSARPPPW